MNDLRTRRVILSEAKDLWGTPDEILRFAQNDNQDSRK
jgi:hypothetical protein